MAEENTMPLEGVEKHKHNYIDNLKVKEIDIVGKVDVDNAVLLTGNQTIAGVKTFSDIPVLPASDATTDNQAVRKSQVDDNLDIVELIASDTLRDSADTMRAQGGSTYVKKKDITFNEIDGTIRIKFDIWKPSGLGTAYGRIYKNGLAFGTERSTTNSTATNFSEDLEFDTGDLVQLYVKTDDANEVRCQNFRLYYDKQLTDYP